MEEKEIENPIKIKAILIKETTASYLLDCEGDTEWFPKSIVNFDQQKEELTLPEWKYKQLGW